MHALTLDIRQALRSLARQPGFVVAAVVSLGIGIGVNAAIFSAVRAVLWQPPAVRNLDRSVVVYHADKRTPDSGTSFAAYERYRDRADVFAGVMAFAGARPLLLIDGDRRDQVYGELVAGDFFSLVNVRLLLGRPPGREIDRRVDPPQVVVLSEALWRERFGADPAIVGAPLNLNGTQFTIAGVAGAPFTGIDVEAVVDLWLPLTSWAHLMGEPRRLTGDEHWMTTVAELAPGISIEQAQAVVSAAAQIVPDATGRQAKVRPIREQSPRFAAEALVIGSAAFSSGLLVLMLACTNVANLLLARAAARQQEMSTRLALGATRGRLIRLWLTEGGLIGIAAAMVGLFVGYWMLDIVVAFKPPMMLGEPGAPTLNISMRFDVGIFAFAFAAAMLTAAAVAFMSGVLGSTPGRMTGGRASDRRFAPGFNLRSGVIAMQVALSMLLLIPCGLMFRSWLNATTIDPGFSADRVLLLPISDQQAGVRVNKPETFVRQIVDRVRTLPGVEAATVVDPVPLWFSGNFAHYRIGGNDEAVRLGHSSVGPGYFDTFRVALLRGRDFDWTDSATAPAVAIVNETMARRFWPDGSALGQRLRRGEVDMEIVGIVRDTRHVSLAERATPWVYQPADQDPPDNLSFSLAVRTEGDPLLHRAGVERHVRAIVPSWPAFQFRTLEEGLELQRALPRLGATILGILGGAGLLLAVVGLYGVMAYLVRQRTREIGIRLALGSPAIRVLALVMKQGMVVCLIGAGIGIGLALLTMPLLSDLLYDISAADPVTYIVTPALLLLAALLACYIPARHVTRVNTLDALRHD
jgi:putative ABC transport system permease protein